MPSVIVGDLALAHAVDPDVAGGGMEQCTTGDVVVQPVASDEAEGADGREQGP